MILEELLYKSRNFNDAEFVAALDPKIVKRLLDELIRLGYQENELVRDIVAALYDWKARRWLKKIRKLLCCDKLEYSIVNRQIYFR